MAMRYVIAMIFAALFALAATLFVSTPVASLIVRNQVFESPDEVMKRWKRVYVCRDVTDENVILTFGLFDGSVEDLRKVQSDLGGEGTRVAQFGPLVDSVLLDGSYEVLDEITP